MTDATPPGVARRSFRIVRQPDGTWTVHPDPPLPATSTYLTDGWRGVARLRQQHQAVEHFPESAHYDAFVREHGPPPVFERA